MVKSNDLLICVGITLLQTVGWLADATPCIAWTVMHDDHDILTGSLLAHEILFSCIRREGTWKICVLDMVGRGIRTDKIVKVSFVQANNLYR